MSYDLVVFNPAIAPRDREAFRAWFAEQTEWTEDRDYADPAGTADGLRRWYDAMRSEYPVMNGPDATDDDNLIDRAGDYNIGENMIYATFPWSLAEEIYSLGRRLAVEHEVGFYDVSADEGDSEIYFPGNILRPPSEGTWREVAREFKESQRNAVPESETE